MADNDNLSNSQLDVTDFLVNGGIAKALDFGDAELSLVLAMANANLAAGKLDIALSNYAMLVVFRPLDVELQCGLANCAVQLQEFDMALEAATSIIALAPNDCRGYYFSALACFALGHKSEAKEDIVDALRLAEISPHREFYDACTKLHAYLSSDST